MFGLFPCRYFQSTGISLEEDRPTKHDYPFKKIIARGNLQQAQRGQRGRWGKKRIALVWSIALTVPQIPFDLSS